MKTRLRTHVVVANPRRSCGYVCGLRLALGANPSLSLCSDISASKYQIFHSIADRNVPTFPD